MELFETIVKRHSYRGAFLDKKIPDEDLRKIVQAGIDAPTGCNAQSVSFVIVNDPATIQAIAKETGEKQVCKTAQAMIICVCDKTPAYGNLSFFVEDCAAATQNMLLAITAFGYATVWIDGAIRGTVAAKIAEILSVPKDKEVRILLPIGAPEKQEKPNTKKSFEQRAWFNRYGG
ncbi:MAG: nitroreductase family protein [Planctomycetaceae bacterium]|jgi:nitroreductase|nr:nitroreductase family protein [Planctomycetaceae bacterium]